MTTATGSHWQAGLGRFLRTLATVLRQRWHGWEEASYLPVSAQAPCPLPPAPPGRHPAARSCRFRQNCQQHLPLGRDLPSRSRPARPHPGHRWRALGLIALFSSYDHLTIAGRNFPIPQQWGIPLIAASVAIVFVEAEGISAAVAQLATGSRLRAEHEPQSVRDRAEQRENEAY